MLLADCAAVALVAIEAIAPSGPDLTIASSRHRPRSSCRRTDSAAPHSARPARASPSTTSSRPCSRSLIGRCFCCLQLASLTGRLIRPKLITRGCFSGASQRDGDRVLLPRHQVAAVVDTGLARSSCVRLPPPRRPPSRPCRAAYAESRCRGQTHRQSHGVGLRLLEAAGGPRLILIIQLHRFYGELGTGNSVDGRQPLDPDALRAIASSASKARVGIWARGGSRSTCPRRPGAYPCG